MARRFSKQAMINYLDARIVRLQQSNNFDNGNGWAQVDGKGEAANRAYGEWDALRNVRDAIESRYIK